MLTSFSSLILFFYFKQQAAATPVFLATVKSKFLKKDPFYYQNFLECDASNEAQDPVLAYRIWEISESILIDRTSSFDDTLSVGDQFSSYTTSFKTDPENRPPMTSTASIDSAKSFE
jgi:hypothetical protein